MVESKTKNIYQTVTDDIFLARVELSNLTKELNIIIARSGPKPVKAQSYEPRTGGSRVENVNDLYNLIIEYKQKITTLRRELDVLKQRKKVIENEFLLTLNDTERNVFVLRRAKLKFEDIADKLCKDPQYIRNVDYKIKRKMQYWAKNYQNYQ